MGSWTPLHKCSLWHAGSIRRAVEVMLSATGGLRWLQRGALVMFSPLTQARGSGLRQDSCA